MKNKHKPERNHMQVHIMLTFETTDGNRLLLVTTKTGTIIGDEGFEKFLDCLRSEYQKAAMAADDYYQLELDLE
jgi:hypothetical protein